MSRPALHALTLALFAGMLLDQCHSKGGGDGMQLTGDAEEGGSGSTTTVSGAACTLYLAPSAIPNAGLGTFTATEIAEGQPIGSPEIVHNVIDLSLHQSPAVADSSGVSDYEWLGSDFQAQVEGRRVYTLFPGLGATINSHPGLHNAIGGMPSQLTSSAPVASDEQQEREHYYGHSNSHHLLDREADAGAGAISYYNGVQGYATRHIEAGSELFSHYSDNYFADRPEVFGLIPLAQDYQSVDKMIARFSRFMEENDEAAKSEQLSEAAIEDLWEAIVNAFEAENKKTKNESVRDDADESNSNGDNLKKGGEEEEEDRQGENNVVAAHDEIAKRLRGVLPDTIADLRRAAEIGSAAHSLPNFIRTREWLDANGKCMDNIRPGLSNIPQAGRGAFAIRFISAGSVILPLPLIHLNRSILDMYDLRDDPNHEGRLLKSKKATRKQILINYCFGHPKSSLLLYPYSMMSSYINHASGDRVANVQLRWLSDEGNMGGFHHPEWFDKAPGTILFHSKPGLMLEAIALVDIQEGDEILLDYGEAWDQAWQEHIATWNDQKERQEGSVNSQRYVYPHELNSEESIIRTEGELKERPYPPNLRVGCLHLHRYSDSSNPIEERSIHRNGPPVKGRAWQEGELYGEDAFYIRPCRILDRRKVNSGDDGADEYLYTVLLDEDKSESDEEIDDRLLFDVPRSGLKFIDRPYQSDQHLKAAFRSEIGLNNEIWPEVWLDLQGGDV